MLDRAPRPVEGGVRHAPVNAILQPTQRLAELATTTRRNRSERRRRQRPSGFDQHQPPLSVNREVTARKIRVSFQISCNREQQAVESPGSTRDLVAFLDPKLNDLMFGLYRARQTLIDGDRGASPLR
jgi:hypothetical protein